MIASEESVELIKDINENIRNKGYYFLDDRRIGLIVNHSPDLQSKTERLRSFARLHHWQVRIHQLGHKALFYTSSLSSPELTGDE